MTRLLMLAFGIMAALATVPAAAAVTTTVGAVTNRYGYYFDSGSPTPDVGGERGQYYETYQDFGSNSSLGVDYVGEASASRFLFLHNDYCVGLCAIRSDTVITFILRNTGSNVEALRFDSQITPGHLARFGDDPRVNTGFTFDVTQSLNGAEAENLYSASGQIITDGIALDTGALTFNGLRSFNDGQGGDVLDWSATNLNLDLARLLPGDELTLTYTASYFVNSFGFCVDLQTGCTGSQVVFGDPRNNGGGDDAASEASAFRFAALAEPQADPVRDIINRDYGAYRVPFSFVQSGSPLPDQPDPSPDLTYGGDFTPPAVPEPASWLMMLMGFGLTGGTLRRRRVRMA